jgi:hypothetical protein
MYEITYGEHQSDFTTATSRTVGTAKTLAGARAIVRSEIGITALRKERAWLGPAEDVVEAWLESLDENCDNGYFIRELSA